MSSMRRNRRKTFEELVNENKQQLLSDRDAIERIEERIERRYEMQLFKQAE
ncbi:hypothetical protein bcere0022_27760 [Bacillus cereus Rock3-44]|nr:hypothetical protein bcere0022_27760 [Bacillus cereus Rock3-44]